MLRDKLALAQKDASKEEDPVRFCTLRLVHAAIKDRDLAHRANGKDPVSDDDIAGILFQMLKQRKESSRLYEEKGRPDLAAQERQEMAVIREFLPAQLPEDKNRRAGPARHGQVHRDAEGPLFRPDGFLKGLRRGQGHAEIGLSCLTAVDIRSGYVG